MRFTDLVSLHCESHFGRHGCALIAGITLANPDDRLLLWLQLRLGPELGP